MALDTVKSPSITNLDTTPIIENNAAQGAPGSWITVDDYCTTTAIGMQTAGSYYKLCRIPTDARVKSVRIATDVAVALAGAPALDLNLIFSDSTMDGTPVFLQGLIPTSGNTGATTTIALYASPNKIFGTVKPGTSSLSITEEVLNGIGTSYAITAGFFNTPLWQVFGFTDGRGYPADPGGYFDLLAYVATGATTGQAANIYAQVSYTK